MLSLAWLGFNSYKWKEGRNL